MFSLLAAFPAQAAPDRVVLEGVPRIGYGVHLCPFPGSLFSVLQYLGDPYDYDYLMGVTGAAFRRLWNRDDGGNVDLMYLAPEPYKRASEAIGYELHPVGHKDRTEMVRALKDSLARSRPVLAFGIIGPPECGLVTGYERGGDELYGYSYFQDAALPGYYKQSGWYEKATWAGDLGFLLIGDKKPHPRPSPRAVLISSLKWAVELARTAKRPGLPNHVAGLAAYDAWAAGLEVDADYPKENAKILETRVMVHGDQCVMLEERHDAAGYLRKQAELVPEAASDLKAAAALYDEVADLGREIWLWGNDMGPAVGQALSEPDTRKAIAASIRRAGDKEAQAVVYLERALGSLDLSSGA